MDFKTLDPPHYPPAVTSNPSSFAWISARKRWPTILTDALDDVHKSLNDSSEERIEEGKRIIHAIGALKHEIEHDKELTPLADDGGTDIKGYNAEVQGERWMATKWLLSESYIYRRLQVLFSTSTHWRGYDVFFRQKDASFRTSAVAVVELATRYKELVLGLEQKTPESQDPAEKKELFVCLFFWQHQRLMM